VEVAAVTEPTGAFAKASAPYPCVPPTLCAYGFFLANHNSRLSHLIVDGQGMVGQGRGLVIASQFVTVDHVTVQNFDSTFAPIMVNDLDAPAGNRDAEAAGPIVVGPGVVSHVTQGNSAGGGLTVEAGHSHGPRRARRGSHIFPGKRSRHLGPWKRRGRHRGDEHRPGEPGHERRGRGQQPERWAGSGAWRPFAEQRARFARHQLGHGHPGEPPPHVAG
jgi:hypothetical protein